jgi:hypothetical protein
MGSNNIDPHVWISYLKKALLSISQADFSFLCIKAIATILGASDHAMEIGVLGANLAECVYGTSNAF